MEPHPPHPRRDPFLAWLAVSALIAATTFGADWSGLDWSAPDDRLLPRSLALALAAGFGLSMPLTCLWVNRGALRRMLRPTAGRILTAVLLAQLVPLGYLEMPVYPWGIVAVMALGSTAPFPWATMTAALLAPVVFLPLTYPVAAALIYGLPRPIRAVFIAAVPPGLIAIVLLFDINTRLTL